MGHIATPQRSPSPREVGERGRHDPILPVKRGWETRSYENNSNSRAYD
jgi:hypothetical protein